MFATLVVSGAAEHFTLTVTPAASAVRGESPDSKVGPKAAENTRKAAERMATDRVERLFTRISLP